MSYQSSLQPISCSLSLSSCRLKAEALARALNNRIWPTALINDCDDHSSGDDALQVTAALKGGPCGTRSTAVIDRPPQAHDIYDSGDKVIGHCWLNGMQTEDDEEYFDTPPCSSPPSPAEEEIIVNPPTHNGIPPFFAEYPYQQHQPQHSEELPSFTGYADDERIASGTKLFEKLRRYSESLSQNEEGSEMFYDVSDYEDYEEQATSDARENVCDRSLSDSNDVIQSAEASESKTAPDLEKSKISECLSSPNTALVTEDIGISDTPLFVNDIDIALISEESDEKCVDPENTGDLSALEKANSAPNDTSAEPCAPLEVTEPAESQIADEPGPEQLVSTNEVLKTSDHDELKFRRKTEFVKPAEVRLSGENFLDYPEIGIVPATPLPSSSSCSSSNFSEEDVRNLPNGPASNSSLQHLSADFRLRRIQELEEEDRPKLLRSTSLKTGKTPPGTPGTKKFVRFADALGLDLEAVRHIVQDDLPNVPTSAYTDLHLVEHDSGSQQPHPRETDPITFPGSLLWDPVAVPGAGSGVQSLIPQFQQPSTKPDFLDRVRSHYVCLESIIVSDLTLHCTCRVLNVAFEKFVAARYTTNEWQTYEEVVASYVPNSSDGVFDKFSFSLFLRYLLPHQRLLFAIRYVVGGQEYWDSNYGHDYAFRSHSNAPALSTTEDGPSWMHHFY